MSDDPIIIPTVWGRVTESARLRAALNMAEDRALRNKVEALLVEQLGDVGHAEMRRRYPESYADEAVQ